MHPDDYRSTEPHAVLVATAAGFPTFDRGDMPNGIERHLPGAVVPTGVVLLQSDRQHVHPTVVLWTPAELGRFIACAHEWADRNGLRFALEAAIDQGRAWARSLPGR